MLKQKFTLQFGINIYQKGIAMIAGIFVARIAGPEVVGTIGFATSYVGLFGFIAGIFATGHIKAVSEGGDVKDNFTTYKYLQGISLAVFVLSASIYLIYSYLIAETPIDKILLIVILLMIIGQLVNYLNEFTNPTYTAKLEQARANAPLTLQTTIYHIGRIIAVLFGLRAIGLAIINLVSAVFTLPYSFGLYKQIPKGKYNKKIATYYWSIAKPIALIVLINSLVANIDRVLLVKYTNVKELGYYTAAYSLGGLFLLVSGSIGRIFFPLFSQLLSQGKVQELNHKISTFISFSALFILPLVLALPLISSWLFDIVLGRVYINSVLPFNFIIFATYVDLISMPFGNLISSLGKFYTTVVINIIKFLVFSAGLYIFLAPSIMGLGAIGVACNLLLVNAFLLVAFFLVARKHFELSLSTKCIYQHVVLILISSTIYSIQTKYLSDFSVTIFFVQLFISYLSLFALNLISKKDLKIFREILNLRSLYMYAKNEISDKKN